MGIRYCSGQEDSGEVCWYFSRKDFALQLGERAIFFKKSFSATLSPFSYPACSVAMQGCDTWISAPVLPTGGICQETPIEADPGFDSNYLQDQPRYSLKLGFINRYNKVT